MQRLSQRILLLSGWRRAIVAFLAGAVTTLTLAPFHLFFVAFLTFPVLVWLLDGAVGASDDSRFGRLWPAFNVGWWFGFGYFLAGLWWLANALLIEAPEFAWAIPLAVLGLPAVLAIFYALAAALARLIWSDGLPRLFALAAAFGIMEWLRTFVFTGFPWNAIGQGITPTPLLMQSIALSGSDAMNVLAVLVFSIPAVFVARQRSAFLGALLLLLLIGGHAGIGYWRLNIVANAEPDGRIIRVVQPAIDQSEKWSPENAKLIFDNLLALTAAPPVDENAARPQVIVWPETSVPFILTNQPAAVTAIADTLQIGQTLVAGVVREETADETEGAQALYYNSMTVIDSEGIITGAADKVHLVPFGEYLPLKEQLEQLGMKAVAAADRGYVGATQRRALDLPSGLKAIPLICYEVIFANEASRLTADDGVIINVTNDAWYGKTPGPYQHFHQSQLRTIELGLPMIRAANNGVSAIIDAKGRIVEQMGYNEMGAFDAPLPGRLLTPFGKRYHSYIFWLIILLFATIGFISRLGR